MRDHDLLDRIARDAPTPRTGLADSVVAAARQRRRRVWTVAGASALAATVAVAVPLTAALTGGGDSPPAPHLSPGGNTSSLAPPPAIDPAAGVYVAALRSQHVLSAPQRGQVRLIRIRASNCDVGPTISGCPHRTPIPSPVQHQVLGALPTGSNARFVAKPATNPPGSYSRRRVVVFVTFSAPQIAGRHARVSVQTWQGFDLLAGSDLELTEDHGDWQVTGVTGSYIT